MPVNKNEVALVLYENIALPPLDGSPPTNQQLREREHTKIFLAEIQLRYPDRPPREDLVNASIDAINLHATITPPVVRQEISNHENILLMPNTAPPVQASATPVQDFLARLAARRGAYNWAGGTSQAFTNWVNGPSPLEHPLNLAAQINCWEAVLVAAAESGVVSMGTVRGAHIGHDVAERVLDILVRMGAFRVNHAAHTPGANPIQAGQVILIPGADGPLHHVVAVVTPDPAEYRNIEVMSLWNAVGGGVFSKVRLEDLLRKATEFWYATL